MRKKITGFKGFDKNLQCRGFQFEVGKEYTHDGEIEVCQSGFHFCENPLDVLSYYPLNSSIFAEVEAIGTVKSDGDKSVTSHLRIGGTLDLAAFVKASVSFIWERASQKRVFGKTSATSGYGAHSATSGNDAHSATSGERANSATSGYGAHSATSGNYAIACSIGRKASAKAALGCWIVLAEWYEGSDFNDARPIGIKAVKVDGKKVKADTFYALKGGKIVEEN